MEAICCFLCARGRGHTLAKARNRARACLCLVVPHGIPLGGSDLLFGLMPSPLSPVSTAVHGQRGFSGGRTRWISDSKGSISVVFRQLLLLLIPVFAFFLFSFFSVETGATPMAAWRCRNISLLFGFGEAFFVRKSVFRSSCSVGTYVCA